MPVRSVACSIVSAQTRPSASSSRSVFSSRSRDSAIEPALNSMYSVSVSAKKVTFIARSPREVAIKESVVNRLAVSEEYHPQIAPVPLRNPRPAPDAAVRLDDLANRGGHGPLDPLVQDAGAVRSGAHREEILRAFHRQIEAVRSTEVSVEIYWARARAASGIGHSRRRIARGRDISPLACPRSIGKDGDISAWRALAAGDQRAYERALTAVLPERHGPECPRAIRSRRRRARAQHAAAQDSGVADPCRGAERPLTIHATRYCCDDGLNSGSTCPFGTRSGWRRPGSNARLGVAGTHMTTPSRNP